MEKEIVSLDDFNFLLSSTWEEIIDFFSSYKKGGIVFFADPNNIPHADLISDACYKFDSINSEGQVVLIPVEDWFATAYDPLMYALRLDRTSATQFINQKLRVFYLRPVNSITFIVKD